MSNVNVQFTREVLRQVWTDVRTLAPNARAREAWVYKLGKDHWEFHFKSFYWHGSADTAYDARVKGWASWLRKAGAKGYADA